jgi:hypothetical protein
VKLIEFVSVSRADARRELVGAPPPETAAATATDLAKRRGETVDELCDDARQWLHDLPTAVRPVALPQTYARIANRICALWNDPLRCARFLTDLMIDRRGNRIGFPPKVAMELATLGAHYESLHPPGRPWT